MPETVLMFNSCLTAASQYDLVAEDEVEMKVNGTVILKEQVPTGKKWSAHISINIVEESV